MFPDPSLGRMNPLLAFGESVGKAWSMFQFSLGRFVWTAQKNSRSVRSRATETG